MNNFIATINNYISHLSNPNDIRILKQAINLLELSPILTRNELEILNEIFTSLREDYTLSIMQDRNNLNYMVVIKKQTKPIIENKHDLNVLLTELKKINSNDSTIENIIINFIDACEHIEENEILIIKQILRYLNNEWSLKPLIKKQYEDETIRYSYLTPCYRKELIKK